MGAAPGSGWEEGEFEFKLVFEEDQGPSPVLTAEPESSVPGEESAECALLHLEPSSSSSLGEFHLLEDYMCLSEDTE